MDIARSVFKASRIALRASHHPVTALDYRGVRLTRVLRHSFRHFFVAELPQRIRYAHALARFIQAERPCAVKPWGGPNFFEGKYLLRLTDGRNKPLFVHYWVGTGVSWPYSDLRYIPDLFLAKS